MKLVVNESNYRGHEMLLILEYINWIECRDAVGVGSSPTSRTYDWINGLLQGDLASIASI